MDYLTTRGLSSGQPNIRETDRILTVLSADRGLLYDEGTRRALQPQQVEGGLPTSDLCGVYRRRGARLFLHHRGDRA